MARTANTNTEVQEAAPEAVEAGRFKRVIVNRPFGNTDSHIFLGFNGFEGHIEFDKPVDLPADMVDYYRSQKRPEFHPDENGRPVVSYSAAYNIMDA